MLAETGEPGIVLVGRPYNIHDAGVNCRSFPRKLRECYGVNVIPLDFLATDAEDIPSSTPTCSGTTGGRSSPPAKIVGATTDEPARHLHHELQVRTGLIHQALHPRGLGQAVPDLQFDGAPERRRGDDALRGVPGQQGLPAHMVARGGRERVRPARGGGRRWPRLRRSGTRRSRRPSRSSASKVVVCTWRRCRTGAATCWPRPSAPSASRPGPPATPTSARSNSAVATRPATSATLRRSRSATTCASCEAGTGRENVALFMPTANGPCRFGQYSAPIRAKLDELGYRRRPHHLPHQFQCNGYSSMGGAYWQDLVRTHWHAVISRGHPA